MPWKECSVMDERVRFVGRLLDGEKMVALCREFAISRKTGYKIFDRYKEYGLGSSDRPFPQALAFANQLLLEPRVGVEPTTCRLRIDCSTTELPRPVS